MALLSCALVGIAAVAPHAEADHCRTKINVYGRSVLAPAPAPPYARTVPFCSESLGEHQLPPQTDQVMVRIHGDFGPSVPNLRVDLDGLGFEESIIILNATESDLGGWTYSMSSWIFAPDPDALDGITVTAHYPAGTVRIHYASAPVFFPISAPPPVTPSGG